ncbi:MAG: sulfatase [Bryobacterales bacterium]|nr:sulfatase [Bryobacterales bacterium]
MDRRCFLRCMSGFGLGSAAVAKPQALRKPNVLFILVDDLGASDLGCYGADLHETPNIDRLAAESIRFTNAYAAAPICTPTRASILTGKCPARLHMTVWREETLRDPVPGRKLVPPRAVSDLPLPEVTLAETLRANGYRTAHIGKWHLGDAAHYPELQGFDINIGGTLWGAPQTYYYPWRGDKRYGGEPRYVPGLGDSKTGDYLPDRLTDEALAFLDKASDQPFFLNVWYYTVHTPIEGKPELVAHYQRKLREGMHHTNVGYAAMVHSMDENIGRLMRKLDETGQASNTIVVFTSDNGGFINLHEGAVVTSNAPWRSGKGSLYEGGIRVPLLMRLPGETGDLCQTPVVSFDLYPTLAELTGSPIPEMQRAAMDGISFAALLRNPHAGLPRRALYFHFPHYYTTSTPVCAVIDGDWKLMEYFEDERLELYHLRDDPYERRNLAEGEPERAGRMRRQLAAWRRSVNAQMPTPSQQPAPPAV